MIKMSREELDNHSYSRNAADGMTYTAIISHGAPKAPWLTMYQAFETTEDRDAFLALMPKSYRFKVNSPQSVRAEFNFHADERTGAANEAAIKRLRSIIKKFDALGLTLTQRADRVTNEQPNLDEVLAIVDPS